MTTESNLPNLPDVDAVRGALRQVIDPEVGVNIVDLGLVYAIDIQAEGVRIEMTMTSAACPMGDMIVDDVYDVLHAVLPSTVQPDVCLVWEPPWAPEMMSDEGKLHFGW